MLFIQANGLQHDIFNNEAKHRENSSMHESALLMEHEFTGSIRRLLSLRGMAH